MGRSRGGLTTKLHALVDGNGLPVRLVLSPGEMHDSQAARDLLAGLPADAVVIADKGYDADWIRELIEEQDAAPNIPMKSNRRERFCFSRRLYRERNLVERFFNRIKQFRRVATRYEKLAANYLAMVKLAAIRLWLRAYESTA